MLQPSCLGRREEFTALLVVALLALAVCGSRSPAASTQSGVATTAPPAASTSPAAAVEQQFVVVVRQTQPQVVQIQTDSCLGSGVMFDAKGNVVTNAHVVGTATHRAALGAGIASGSSRAGAVVVAVQPGGRAGKAGISAGDVIEKIDGSPIADATDLGTALAARRPGQKIILSIVGGMTGQP